MGNTFVYYGLALLLAALFLLLSSAALWRLRKSLRSSQVLNEQFKKELATRVSAEKHLEEILNALTDPIFVKDRQHRWVLLNDACCRFIGHPRTALIGRSDYEFFPKKEADIFWEKDELVFRTEKHNLNEEEFTDSKGVTHTITTQKNFYKDRSGQSFIVGMIRDVTDKKNTEKAFKRQTVDLAHSQTERENLELFAYVASHDLREPLQAIIGFADLLENTSAENLGDTGKGYLKRIQDAAGRMGQLIDDLLKFARVVQKAEVFTTVDLKKIMQEIVEDLDLRIKKTGSRIEVTHLPAVRGDESQIRQLFHNLLSNALKFYSPERESRISVTARVLEDHRVEICVQDNGIGFDEKSAERIFKPFERLRGRKEYEGSGIGLAICKKIVIHHEGKIYAHSRPGEGSEFFVVLQKADLGG